MSNPDLHQRYRDYLSQYELGVDFTSDESTWLTTARLKSLALGKGYNLREIRAALDALKDDVDIACLWYSTDRTERICKYPLTEDECKRMIADREWFDSLPSK